MSSGRGAVRMGVRVRMMRRVVSRGRRARGPKGVDSLLERDDIELVGLHPPVIVPIVGVVGLPS